MHRHARADERTRPHELDRLQHILPFAREQPEVFREILRQPRSIHAERLQPIRQLHHRSLAHQAIRVTDDDDFAPALHRARQRQRTHRAAHRSGDDVPGVAQPDEVRLGNAEHLRHERIQTRIDARQCDDRERIGKLRRVQSGAVITGERAVIRINDGFKQAHGFESKVKSGLLSGKEQCARVSEAVIERFDNMPVEIPNPHRMKKVLIVGGIGLLALSGLLLVGGLIQFILPPVYESVARVADNRDDIRSKLGMSGAFPGVGETERFQSKSVLYQVITNLDLNRRWGEKFKEDTLGTETTYAMLKRRLNVRQAPDTGIIEVRVQSDDPAEAAAIANGIAGVRLEQRSAWLREVILHGIEALNSDAQRSAVEIQTLEEQLKQLGEKLNQAVDAPRPPRLEKGDPQIEFNKLRRELDVLKILREKLTARLEEERIESLVVCKNSSMPLIDAAEPNLRPIKPHPVMKVVVPISGLLAGVTGVVLLVLGVVKKEQINQPPHPKPSPTQPTVQPHSAFLPSAGGIGKVD